MKTQKSLWRKASFRKECQFCTSCHEPCKEQCPAYGRICLMCQGKNQFVAKCKLVRKCLQTMHTEQLSEDSSSSQSDFEHVDIVVTEEKADSLTHGTIRSEMVGYDKIIAFQIDSGVSVNVLSAKNVHERYLKCSNKTLVRWNGTEMEPLGKCHVKLSNPQMEKKVCHEFYDCERRIGPTLRCNGYTKNGLGQREQREFLDGG